MGPARPAGVFSVLPATCDSHTYREAVSMGITTISKCVFSLACAFSLVSSVTQCVLR